MAVDAGRFEIRQQIVAVPVAPDLADQRDRIAEFGNCDSLVGPLAARKEPKTAARNRLPTIWDRPGVNNQICIDAADDDNRLHGSSQSGPTTAAHAAEHASQSGRIRLGLV